MKKEIKIFLNLLIYIFVGLFDLIIRPFKRYVFFVIQSVRMAKWKTKLGSLGDNVEIYPDVIMHFSKNIKIGNNVSITEFVHMWGAGGIEIGDDTVIAAHSIITSQTHDANADSYRSTQVFKPVKIGKNVWIGSGAIILPGITVGDNAIVGAGSVVTHDVEPNITVVGIPARILQRIERK